MIAARWTEGGLTETYALSGRVFYLAYLAAVLRTARRDGTALARALRAAAPGSATWAAIALHALSGV